MALASCGGSDSGSESGISDQAHREYVAGCVDSGQNREGCECLYQQLTTKQGVDTEPKFKRLIEKVSAASQTADPVAALPPEFREASLACKSSIS